MLAVLSPPLMATLNAHAKMSAAASSSMMRVASWLPAQHVPEMSTDCLRELAVAAPDAPLEQLTPLLQCACAWDMEGALLAQISEALKAPGGADIGHKRDRRTRGKPARTKVTSAEDAPSATPPPALAPAVALRVLWAALTNATTRASLLRTHRDEMHAMLPLLRLRLDAASDAPSADAPSADAPTGSESQLALCCYMQVRPITRTQP